MMVDTVSGNEFKFLDDLAPQFAICGNDVRVLNSPSEFYQCLLNGISSSKKRIVLSALYLGVGKHEKELVKCLDETLHKREKENLSMDVDLLFDYVRGSRGKCNSKTLLLPLVKKYASSEVSKSNLSVYFYHTPFLRGATKQMLPPRFNEIVGLNHLKIFIFDDHFLISGANLSTEYFEQRQDRYIMFENCKELSDYFHSLVQAVGSFSFQLQPNGDETLSKYCPSHPFTGDQSLFEEYVFKSLTKVIQMRDDCCSEKNSNIPLSMHNSAKTSNSVTSDSGFKPTENVHSITAATHDTLVYPSIQFGLVGMRQDERLTMKLLNSFSQGSYICFTSGYFNITDAYSSKILQSLADFDIVTASPNANGFLKASGAAGRIPAVYSHLTKKFFDEIWHSGKAGNIRLWEYLRPSWTYHAKGLWFYDHSKNLPSLTTIGSSNYGQRSVYRDLEAQVTIVTKNKNLMKQLHHEKCNIMKDSSILSNETFAESRYYVPRWVSFVTTFIKRYF